MKPAPFIVEAQSFTKDEVKRLAPELTEDDPNEEDDDPWAAIT